MAVEISTPSFEGPIEVLAQLISDHRVDIYEIRLADIVSEFLEALLADQPPGLEEQSEFLLTVAILLELKSRRLLPGPDAVEADEELDGLEERDRLLARLIELQAYARAAELFAVMVEQASRSVPRTAGLEDQFVGLAPDLLEGLAPEDLLAAFRRVMTERPVPVLDLSHVTVEAVTVSEALADVASRLALARRSTFRDLTAHCTTRMQVIVRFLALLELAKRGRVLLDQGDTFGDLHVSWLDDPDQPYEDASLDIPAGADRLAGDSASRPADGRLLGVTPHGSQAEEYDG